MLTQSMSSKNKKHRPSSTIPRTGPSLKLAVQYAVGTTHDSALLPTRTQLRKWAKAALQQDIQITIRMVDEAEGCDLNHRFRGKNQATNVLTFVYDDMQPLSGDIVLCATVIAHEACQQDKTLTAHYAHLVIHGMLHLQGYDHEHESDASVMEQLETTLMLALGYDNPYQLSVKCTQVTGQE